MAPDNSDTNPVVIATAPTKMEADVVRAVLSEEGIPTYDVGGVGSGVYGVGSNVQVAVPPSDVEKAKEVLKDAGINIDLEWAPNQRAFGELNRFWPREKRSIRYLVRLYLGFLVVAGLTGLFYWFLRKSI